MSPHDACHQIRAFIVSSSTVCVWQGCAGCSVVAVSCAAARTAPVPTFGSVAVACNMPKSGHGSGSGARPENLVDTCGRPKKGHPNWKRRPSGRYKQKTVAARVAAKALTMTTRSSARLQDAQASAAAGSARRLRKKQSQPPRQVCCGPCGWLEKVRSRSSSVQPNMSKYLV